MSGVRAIDWERILSLGHFMSLAQQESLLALAHVYGDREDNLNPQNVRMVADPPEPSALVAQIPDVGTFEILTTGAVRQIPDRPQQNQEPR